jgi:hypothetical protein
VRRLLLLLDRRCLQDEAGQLLAKLLKRIFHHHLLHRNVSLYFGDAFLNLLHEIPTVSTFK